MTDTLFGPSRQTAFEALRQKATQHFEAADYHRKQACGLMNLLECLESMNRFAADTNAAAGEGDGPAPSLGVGSGAETALWSLVMDSKVQHG
jgi:hypothetical protein